jgi:hypothetical protein
VNLMLNMFHDPKLTRIASVLLPFTYVTFGLLSTRACTVTKVGSRPSLKFSSFASSPGANPRYLGPLLVMDSAFMWGLRTANLIISAVWSGPSFLL